MNEKELDQLAGFGERLSVLRQREDLDPDVDEAVAAAGAICSTLVLYVDHDKVPEPLQDAIAHQIRAVGRQRDERERLDREWSDNEGLACPVAGTSHLPSGLGGTRRGRPTQRTW